MRAPVVLPLVALAWLATATACTSLFGVDFDGRPAPTDPADANASSDAPADFDADGAIGDGGSSDAPEGFDPSWSRWAVSGSFPANQTTRTGETIADRVTGLVWAADPLPTPVGWDDAEPACRGLRVAGFDDWRVPTRIELLSTVNYFFVGPASSVDFTTPLADSWTASPFAGDSTRAWYVSFHRGATVDRSKAESLTLRCVRAGVVVKNAPPTRFVTGFGTVFDTQTNLTWQAAHAVGGTFDAVNLTCSQLSLNGVKGFRVPEAHELHSIVDEHRVNPALDPVFGAGSLVWSSTRLSGSPDYNWTVDEFDGHTLEYDRTKVTSVRCVR